MEQQFYWTAKLFVDGKAKEAKYFKTEEERNRYIEEHPGWLKRGKICAENLESHIVEAQNLGRETGVKNTEQVWEKDGYILRLARKTDLDDYYEQNYNPLDSEAARLTGCKEAFTREEVATFFYRSLEDDDRYLFLIIAPDGRIIGETVINEIDFDLRCANFRMGIYQPTERGKGIGTWAAEVTRDFAFEVLKLHRLSLDVFSFNPRAERVYLKIGFRREGVLRDEVRDGEKYADDILMGMLEDEWREIHGKN